LTIKCENLKRKIINKKLGIKELYNLEKLKEKNESNIKINLMKKYIKF
jgi:hypothetical protein